MLKIGLKIIIFAIFLLVSICGCVGCDNITKLNDTNIETVIQSTLIPTPTILISQNKDEENVFEKTDAIMDVVKTCVNDIIWYNESSSEIHSLQDNSMEIDIYTSTIETDKIWILFKKRLNDSYYALSFKSDKRGLLNYIFSYFSKDTFSELENEIKREKYDKYNSTVINFNEAKPPEYDVMSKDKEAILNNIYDLVKDVLQIWNFNSGEYIVSVRNFRKNDWNTYVIISNTNQDKWILDVCINDDGSVEENKFYKAENELLKNIVKKYEELLIEKTSFRMLVQE